MIKRLSVFFLIAGITGAVVFFPFNFNDRYTCLYHRVCNPAQPVSSTPHHRHQAAAPENILDANPAGHHLAANSLIPHYLNHFAFFWWASLLVVGLWLFLFKRKNGIVSVPDFDEPDWHKDDLKKNSKTAYPSK